MSDFDNIFLSRKELKILKKLSKDISLPEDYLYQNFPHLISFGFVYQAQTKQNAYGKLLYYGNYVINDKGRQYLHYHKEKFFIAKLPVTLSIIALIGAFRQEIFWLIQAIEKLLKILAGI